MHNPFGQRSIERSIDPDDIEKALSQFCAPPAFDKKTTSQPSISDNTFQRISGLLSHLQAAHHACGWSDRPRTYTVLRNINRLDLFQSFIDLGLNDIAFPYTIEKLPEVIHEDDLRRRFLRHQRYILTAASHLEAGRHAHTKNGDDLFRLVRHLGRGGFGYVRYQPYTFPICRNPGRVPHIPAHLLPGEPIVLRDTDINTAQSILYGVA